MNHSKLSHSPLFPHSTSNHPFLSLISLESQYVLARRGRWRHARNSHSRWSAIFDKWRRDQQWRGQHGNVKRWAHRNRHASDELSALWRRSSHWHDQCDTGRRFESRFSSHLEQLDNANIVSEAIIAIATSDEQDARTS